jgi:DNA (cytosine-5)-methyltransferase 1
MEVKVIGQMDNTIDHTFESANRVYDVGGVSPTINTCGGGGLQPKIIDDTYANRQPRVYEDYSPALRSEREGLKTIEQDICRIENLIIGGEQKHQAIKKDGVCTCLTSSMGTGGGYVPMIAPQYRIRKLTPKECWRLMDFTDEDFEKAAQVNSNTQLYRQAGNSICKNVLVAIIGQMIPGKEDVYKKLETR